MLTEEQIVHYVREGYVLARGLADGETIATMRELAEAALAANYQDHLDHGGGARDWQPVSFDQRKLERNDPRLHAVFWDPGVLTAAEQLLGTEPYLLHGMLAAVPHGGRGLPWHQDNMYVHFLEGALNIFVAVTRITPDMGGLWVAPRSHVQGVLPNHRCDGTGDVAQGHHEVDEEPENPTPMPTMEPGDVCIFNRYTLHRSTPNTTDQVRLAYAAQFHAAYARCVDGTKHATTRLARYFAKAVGSA